MITSDQGSEVSNNLDKMLMKVLKNTQVFCNEN